MGHPALVLAGRLVELGLGIDLEISGRAGRCLVVQCPELGFPTSEAQASLQARARRPCQPHSSEAKGKKKKEKRFFLIIKTNFKIKK